MFYLDKLKDLKLYKNKKIKGLNSKIKDNKFNQLILHIGNNEEDLINFLNSELFMNIYFNNFYTDSVITSKNKVKKKIVRRQEVYKNISEKTNIKLNYRNNITAFKNKNLFFDLTPQLLLNKNSLKKSLIKKTDDFFEICKEKLNSFSTYENKVILFNVDNFDSDDKDNFLYFFNNALKKKLPSLLNNLNNETIIFYSVNNNCWFKLTLNEKILKTKRQIIKTRIEALKNIVPIQDIIDLDNKEEEKITKAEVIVRKKEETKNEAKELIKNSLNLNKEEENDEEFKEVQEEIDQVIEEETDGKNNISEEELMTIMNNNTALKKSLDDMMQNKLTGHPKIDHSLLREQQDKVSFKDVSLKDSILNYKEKCIDNEDVTKGILEDKVVNKEILYNNMRNFDESYMKKKYNKDMASVLKSFNNNPDIGLFVKKVNLEDSSTDLDKKQTLKVEFKDDTGTTHNFKVDIPEVKEGRFIYVNGNKKLIMKQITFLPIVKLGPDKVQVTTNYNKVFIERFGRKRSEKLDYLKKLFTTVNLNAHKNSNAKTDIKLGNSLKINSKYITSIEYNDISEYLLELNIADYHLLFNQDEIKLKLDPKDINYLEKFAVKANINKKKYFIIGYDKNYNTIVSDLDSKEVYLFKNNSYELLSKSLSTFLLTLIEENFDKNAIDKVVSSKIKTSAKLTYSRIEINNKIIPLAVLIAYEIGLLNLLERYNIKYEFSEKNKSININDDIAKMKFKDGYLYYDTSKMRNTILLSGLNVMDTEEINFADMNTVDPYLDLYESLYHSRNAAKGFHNTMTLLMDPITKEVLQELKLPDNTIDLFLYANTLLEDLSYHEESDCSQMRIRCAEQIPAMLYKVLADSFKAYKDSRSARVPQKISVPEDFLIKKLNELKSFDAYSSLNPTLEMERLGNASMKGVTGRNSDDSYTKSVRKFNDNMTGLIAISSPIGSKIGAVRQLTYNPKISSVYGFVDVDKKLNGSTDVYDPTELVNVFNGLYSDPPRICMQTSQQKHVVSIADPDPFLVGSGVEKTIPYIISDEFTFKAKKDGIIESINSKDKVAIIKYNDGTKDCIDLDGTLVNNSNGGFLNYQTYELLFHVGEKFKKGEIIAKNPLFFSGDGRSEDSDISYNLGKLAKVAITSADFTYEDSSIITEELSDKMKTKITMKKDKILKGDSTVSFIAKEGQRIKTGDPLLIFENAFDDESMNSILNKIGNDFSEEIKDLSKNVFKCKYTGRVVKINIYYNAEVEEYSESIQKILKQYIAKGKSKRKIIQSIKGNGFDSINCPIIEKQNDTKIKGVEIGEKGILFEFYIEYEDSLGIGDKITYNTALKTIISNIIPKDEEPYSELHPDEKIDAVLSPLSIVSRMTVDVFMDGFINKALIELKRECKEIFES